MTEQQFWMNIRQALLMLVDAVEKTKLNYGQPDPVTNLTKITTGDLRKQWKRRQATA
jgi:hypothetical protein